MNVNMSNIELQGGYVLSIKPAVKNPLTDLFGY